MMQFLAVVLSEQIAVEWPMDIYLSMIVERMARQGYVMGDWTGLDIVIEQIRLGRSQPVSDRVLNIYINTDNKVLMVCNHVIICVEEHALEDVFNAALSAWEYYHNWYDSLAKAVVDGAPMQVLVDISTPMFENPMFIANWQGDVFAFSKEYALNNHHVWQERTFWQSIVTTGKLPITTIQRLRESPNRDLVLHGQGASVMRFEKYNYTCIIGTINHQSDVHLHLQIIQSDTELTDVTCMLANVLLKEIRKIRLPDLSLGMTSLVSMFCKLLDGTSVSSEDLHWAMATLGWGRNETYILIGFLNEESPRIAEALCGQIEKNLPQSITFVYNNQPISIMSEENFIIYRPKIEECMRKLEFAGGVSVPFMNWDNLPAYYKQTQIAIRYRSGDMQLSACYDHAWAYLTDQLLDLEANTELCHPAIITLKDYDDKNGTQLLDTIYMYLRCERNAVMASDRLYIHRNTLQYRLRRINEMISINLDDPDVRSHLMLSYQMLLRRE